MCFSRIDATVEDLTVLASQFGTSLDSFDPAADTALDRLDADAADTASTNADAADAEALGPSR